MVKESQINQNRDIFKFNNILHQLRSTQRVTTARSMVSTTGLVATTSTNSTENGSSLVMEEVMFGKKIIPKIKMI